LERLFFRQAKTNDNEFLPQKKREAEKVLNKIMMKAN
jgi:hypothetical protein